MGIRGAKQVQTVVGFVCDVCRQPCHQEEGYHTTEYGILRAEWGYWSSKDQTAEECHLCETCFGRVRDFIVSLGGNVRQREQ